jgi:hypothetical protein
MGRRTPEGYLQELEEIASRLSDYLQKIDEGNASYYKDLALKLRVLLLRKSRTPPLLEIVFDLFQCDVLVAVMWSIREQIEKLGDPKGVRAGMLSALQYEQLNSARTWLEMGHEKVHILEAVSRDEIYLNNRHVSLKELIEVVADKMTAHIDPEIDNHHLYLHDESIASFLGSPPAQLAICEASRTTITILRGLVNYARTGEVEIFIEPRK